MGFIPSGVFGAFASLTAAFGAAADGNDVPHHAPTFDGVEVAQQIVIGDGASARKGVIGDGRPVPGLMQPPVFPIPGGGETSIHKNFDANTGMSDDSNSPAESEQENSNCAASSSTILPGKAYVTGAGESTATSLPVISRCP